MQTLFCLWPAEPPAFTAKPDNQDVIPGTTVSFRAAFTGTAPLAVKWFREDKEIITGGTCFIKKDSSSSSLELHSVKPSDSAKYTCQVSNDAGKVDCNAALFVKGAFLQYHVQLHKNVLTFFSDISISFDTNDMLLSDNKC